MVYPRYIIRVFRDHLGFLATASVLVGGLQVLILTVVVEMQFLEVLKFILDQLPERVQMVLGEQFLTQMSLAGASLVGYNHPVVLTFLAVLAIMLPSRHLAGELEEGSLELLLALPVRRWRVLFSLWVSAVLMLLLVTAAAWIGTALGRLLYPSPDHLPFLKIIQVGINLWLVMAVVSSYTFLIALLSKEAGRAAMRAAGLTLFFFFWNYTTQIWSTVQSLEILSIFYYYQPRQILSGEPGYAGNLLVLIALAFVLTTISLYRIESRDMAG